MFVNGVIVALNVAKMNLADVVSENFYQMTNPNPKEIKIHKPGCMANMHCLVIHPDGICPGPYGQCTCGQTEGPKEKENKVYELCTSDKCLVCKEQDWQEWKTNFIQNLPEWSQYVADDELEKMRTRFFSHPKASEDKEI